MLKKRIFSLAILLVGITMAFTLIGCDTTGDNGGNGDNSGDGETVDVNVYLGIGVGFDGGYHEPLHQNELSETCIELYWNLNLWNSGGNMHQDVEWNIDALGTEVISAYDGDYEVIVDDDSEELVMIKDWVTISTTPANFLDSAWSPNVVMTLDDSYGNDVYNSFDFVWVHPNRNTINPGALNSITVTIKASKLSEIKQYIRYVGSESKYKINLYVDEQNTATW